MKIFRNSLVICMILFLCSCASKKNIHYFQFDEVDQEKVSNTYSTIFKLDDLLQITITAQDIKAVKPFNQVAVVFSNSADSPVGQPLQQLYLVDNMGNIDLPVIGTFHIAGLTRNEAIKKLKDILDPDYVKNPAINIRIANYKVTVLGDVNKPGSYTIPNERITILEALGLAGDLTITGERHSVVVEREVEDKKKFYELDLTSKKMFTSPAFYLQQNDVVYVKQNQASVQKSVVNPNTGLFVSIASVVISLLTLATR